MTDAAGCRPPAVMRWKLGGRNAGVGTQLGPIHWASQGAGGGHAPGLVSGADPGAALGGAVCRRLLLKHAPHKTKADCGIQPQRFESSNLARPSGKENSLLQERRFFRCSSVQPACHPGVANAHLEQLKHTPGKKSRGAEQRQLVAIFLGPT